jgi:putative redox protein
MAQHKAVLKQVEGLTFVGKADSNHWVAVDTSEAVGGNAAGTTPKELILIGLAGCTAMDVVSILKKKRIDLKDFQIEVTAEIAEEHPKVYTKINLEYVCYGKDIQARDVERAIELSETKYCAVSAMLKNSVNITTSFRIEEK